MAIRTRRQTPTTDLDLRRTAFRSQSNTDHMSQVKRRGFRLRSLRVRVRSGCAPPQNRGAAAGMHCCVTCNELTAPTQWVSRREVAATNMFRTDWLIWADEVAINDDEGVDAQLAMLEAIEGANVLPIYWYRGSLASG